MSITDGISFFEALTMTGGSVIEIALLVFLIQNFLDSRFWIW